MSLNHFAVWISLLLFSKYIRNILVLYTAMLIETYLSKLQLQRIMSDYVTERFFITYI